MRNPTSIFFLIAVVFTTAIFLSAQSPKATYTFQKVEVIETNASNGAVIYDLEINSTVGSEHLIATSKGSRTEFIQDGTFWRLGSMSVGRWLNPNHFWLHSGSLLYCSEKAREITFSTITSTASFNGSGTIIIEATKNGGFKFIPLEAKGKISTAKGGIKEIVGGRMLLIIGEPTYYGDAYDIDIMLMVRSSRLINAFPSPLPTFEQIGLAIYVQELKLKGKYDALIGDATTNENLQLWKFGEIKKQSKKSTTPKKTFWGKIFGSD